MRVFIVWTVAVLLAAAGCGKKDEVPVLRAVDTENMEMVVLTGEKTQADEFHKAEFVVFGGTLGGIAAALSICYSARTVILIEESSHIAGCFSLGDTVYFDDNILIDNTGASRAYQTFRRKIRQWYADRSQEPPDPGLNITELGAFQPDRICFDTEAALDVLDEMLEESIERGRLSILTRHKVAAARTFNDRVASFMLIDLDNHVASQVTGWMYIDATRTGDTLPLIGADFSIGRESRDVTGEPHAPETADPLVGQTTLYCVPASPLTEDLQAALPLTEQRPGETAGAMNCVMLDEPRRIDALRRIDEGDLTGGDGPRARFFSDAVGIGHYPIRIPDPSAASGYTVIPTKPFQIPLAALIPKQYANLLAGGGNIGATYIASTAFQTPALRWAVGEAAGYAAAFCAGTKVDTHQLAGSIDHVRDLQRWLVESKGVPIYWYDDVAPDDPDFAEAQLAPFAAEGGPSGGGDLHYRK